MKLTNAEILNVKGPLSYLMELKFPVKTSLALATLVRKLDEFLIPVEQVRDGLIKTYGKPDPENSQRTMIDSTCEGFEKFMVEYGELMTQEVEVVIEKVTLPDTLEIEPGTVMALEKFITIL